jgi:hypothetical protein
VWFSGYGWDVQSLNPLLTTSVTSNVQDSVSVLACTLIHGDFVTVASTWPVPAHGTVICTFSRRSLHHTRPPVPGARACGQYLSQEDRTRCFHEDVSQAIPIAGLMWLQLQLLRQLQLESNSGPHVHGGYALVVTSLDGHRELAVQAVIG